MENIRLKFHTEKGPVELEMPPKASLLKTALKLATNQQEVRREYPPDEFFEERDQMPKVFRKVKGFRKIFDRLKKNFGGYYGETWTIDNKTRIEENAQSQMIDRKALDMECRETLDNIHRNNVKAIAVHVRGCLSNEENAYIIDRISRDFNCTIIKYFTTESLHVTTLDIAFFGSNISKKPPWMMFM